MRGNNLETLMEAQIQNKSALFPYAKLTTSAHRSLVRPKLNATRKRYDVKSLKTEMQTVLAEMRREVRIRTLLLHELLSATTAVERDLIEDLLKNNKETIAGLERRCKRTRKEALVMGVKPEELEARTLDPIQIPASATAFTLG